MKKDQEVKKSKPSQKDQKSILKTKKIIRLENKDSTQSISLSDSKLSQLLDLSHLGELFFVVQLLNEDQVKRFIEQYNKSKRSPDKKIDSIIISSKNKEDLLRGLRDEIIVEFRDELKKIGEDISFLRRKGMDMGLEDIKILSIPLKIKLFSATIKREDYYKVKKLIDDISKDIEEKKKDIKI